MQELRKIGCSYLETVKHVLQRIRPSKAIRWEVFVVCVGAQAALCFVLFAYGFVAGGCLTIASLCTATLAIITKQRAAVLFHALTALITMFYFVIGTGYRIDGVEPIHGDPGGVALSITQACLSVGFMSLSLVIAYVDNLKGADVKAVKQASADISFVHATQPQILAREPEAKNYFTSDEFRRVREAILRDATPSDAEDKVTCEGGGDLCPEVRGFLDRLKSMTDGNNRAPDVLPSLELWRGRCAPHLSPFQYFESEPSPEIIADENCSRDLAPFSHQSLPSTLPPQLMEQSGSPFGALYAVRDVPRIVFESEGPKITAADPAPSEPLPRTRTPITTKFVESFNIDDFSNDRRPTSAATTDLVDGIALQRLLTTEGVEEEQVFDQRNNNK